MPKESTLTTKILACLRHDYGAKAEKMRGSAFATKGTPDILGCCQGRTLAIEVKRPGGEAPFYDHEPTPKQHYELTAWRDAGAVAGVIRSIKELGQFMETIG
jgi:hypothetical protein